MKNQTKTPNQQNFFKKNRKFRSLKSDWQQLLTMFSNIHGQQGPVATVCWKVGNQRNEVHLVLRWQTFSFTATTQQDPVVELPLPQDLCFSTNVLHKTHQPSHSPPVMSDHSPGSEWPQVPCDLHLCGHSSYSLMIPFLYFIWNWSSKGMLKVHSTDYGSLKSIRNQVLTRLRGGIYSLSFPSL